MFREWGLYQVNPRYNEVLSRKCDRRKYRPLSGCDAEPRLHRYCDRRLRAQPPHGRSVSTAKDVLAGCPADQGGGVCLRPLVRDRHPEGCLFSSGRATCAPRSLSLSGRRATSGSSCESSREVDMIADPAPIPVIQPHKKPDRECPAFAHPSCGFRVCVSRFPRCQSLMERARLLVARGREVWISSLPRG